MTVPCVQSARKSSSEPSRATRPSRRSIDATVEGTKPCGVRSYVRLAQLSPSLLEKGRHCCEITGMDQTYGPSFRPFARPLRITPWSFEVWCGWIAHRCVVQLRRTNTDRCSEDHRDIRPQRVVQDGSLRLG